MIGCGVLMCWFLISALGLMPLPCVVTQVFFSCWQVSIWNTMHAFFHGRCAWNEGQPLGLPYDMAKRLSTYPYFSWIVLNHLNHHSVKGTEKRNFNIVFPGADFFFGTYRRC